MCKISRTPEGAIMLSDQNGAMDLSKRTLEKVDIDTGQGLAHLAFSPVDGEKQEVWVSFPVQGLQHLGLDTSEPQRLYMSFCDYVRNLKISGGLDQALTQLETTTDLSVSCFKEMKNSILDKVTDPDLRTELIQKINTLAAALNGITPVKNGINAVRADYQQV